jgi:hypothetical protein
VIPILASVLIGVVAKVGVGLAAAATRKLFTRSPAASAPEPRRPFVDELDRARSQATATPAAAALVPAAPLAPAATTPALALRSLRGRAARPVVEAPPLTTDPARLAISARAGRRRGSAGVSRLGRHHVGAYRRLDLGPR